MEALFLGFDFNLLLFLLFAAFVAGFIDAIAGGGGMITLPALLLSGASPIEALATNKLQSSFGSFSATYQFYKRGYIPLKSALPYAILAFIFSAFGTILVQFVDSSFLKKFLPFLILIFGIYFLFSPKITQDLQEKRKKFAPLVISLALISFYDGFFGPGTGSFFMLSLLIFGAFSISEALGQAKLYNFSTNLASLIFFAIGGNMLFGVGLIMAIGQIIGANLGSKAAMRYGIKLIKPLVVCVSFIMATKLLYEEF